MASYAKHHSAKSPELLNKSLVNAYTTAASAPCQLCDNCVVLCTKPGMRLQMFRLIFSIESPSKQLFPNSFILSEFTVEMS